MQRALKKFNCKKCETYPGDALNSVWYPEFLKPCFRDHQGKIDIKTLRLLCSLLLHIDRYTVTQLYLVINYVGAGKDC